MIETPALRYHGGKFRLAPWIISHFPPHRCYVEAFGGAAGVLLQKPRSFSEVYNDLDGDVVDFFRVLRAPELCARLVEELRLTPYSRSEFELSYETTDDIVEKARRIATRAAMGFGSAGVSRAAKTGFRSDCKRSFSTPQHVWVKYPDRLKEVADRFAGVLIENRPANELIMAKDDADTLFYLDPPYPKGTRESFGAYDFEMSDAEHEELLKLLNQVRGMVVLSGYENDLYAEYLSDWLLVKTMTAASGNAGGVQRLECLWLNPACSKALNQERAQLEFFDEVTV